MGTKPDDDASNIKTVTGKTKKDKRESARHSFMLSVGNKELEVTGFYGLVALVIITIVLALVMVQTGLSFA